MPIFIVAMEKKTLKSKRLKMVRTLMYLDVLLVVLSLAMLDFRHLAFVENSAAYVRILILILIFFILYFVEKNISRYLRKHTED